MHIVCTPIFSTIYFLIKSVEEVEANSLEKGIMITVSMPYDSISSIRSSIVDRSETWGLSFLGTINCGWGWKVTITVL